MEYGLIGKKLSHSKSVLIHSIIADYKYELCELCEDEVEVFFKKREFKGINVTIPYKKIAHQCCDELSEAARECGSVNTVIKRDNGTLYGDNTDCYGFLTLLNSSGVSVKGKKCLVFGSGGASLAVNYVLKKEGARKIITVSRSSENNYENLHLHKDAEILVNCTPVGMFPHNDECIVDIKYFPECKLALDLIYNPLNTKFISDARQLGIPAAGGLKMLVYQAKRASSIFTGKDIPEESCHKAERACLDEMQNIVLIGMPGCGKTTLGKIVAKKLGKAFFDTDEMIKEAYQKSAEEIINEYGIERFREIESEIVKSACGENGAVIATGGGAILREDNRFYMKQNGFVVHISRDIEKLSTDGRPLSSSFDKIRKLYKERLPIYTALRDTELCVGDILEENAENLEKIINNRWNKI